MSGEEFVKTRYPEEPGNIGNEVFSIDRPE
jgi:hypothetical protein